MLSPLLGTYVLFTLVRTPDTTDVRWQQFKIVFLAYELFQAAADRVQGVAVSLAFCFLTKEVREIVSRKILRRSSDSILIRTSGSRSSIANASRQSHMPLRKVHSSPDSMDDEMEKDDETFHSGRRNSNSRLRPLGRSKVQFNNHGRNNLHVIDENV